MGLLPKSPAMRAQVQALSQSIAVDVHPVCNLQVVEYAASISTSPSEARKNWMKRFIRPGLEAFESQLGMFDQHPYCVGKTPGLADICLMPQLYNARRWGVEFADLPRIVGVEAACSMHPEFCAAHPDAVQPQ